MEEKHIFFSMLLLFKQNIKKACKKIKTEQINSLDVNFCLNLIRYCEFNKTKQNLINKQALLIFYTYSNNYFNIYRIVQQIYEICMFKMLMEMSVILPITSLFIQVQCFNSSEIIVLQNSIIQIKDFLDFQELGCSYRHQCNLSNVTLF